MVYIIKNSDKKFDAKIIKKICKYETKKLTFTYPLFTRL